MYIYSGLSCSLEFRTCIFIRHETLKACFNELETTNHVTQKTSHGGSVSALVLTSIKMVIATTCRRRVKTFVSVRIQWWEWKVKQREDDERGEGWERRMLQCVARVITKTDVPLGVINNVHIMNCKCKFSPFLGASDKKGNRRESRGSGHCTRVLRTKAVKKRMNTENNDDFKKRVM